LEIEEVELNTLGWIVDLRNLCSCIIVMQQFGLIRKNAYSLLQAVVLKCVAFEVKRGNI